MSVLSREPDGLGYHYGRLDDDPRQINIRRGPVDWLWRAWVGGVRVGDDTEGVWADKDEAEAAALAWLKANPRQSA